MKISFKGDYALKIIFDLALNYEKGITQIRDIAKRQDIPERFLEQIITLLKGAGFVKTVRGPRGGVLLAKDPSNITMGHVIRLIEGPTSPITCVSRSCHVKCSFEKKCVLRDVFENVRDKINEVVDNATFKDLVDADKRKKHAAAHDYSI